MKFTIPRFDLAKILVVGDIMLDKYWHGATSRISPEAPVPIVKVGQIEERPGGAGNVALNIASLGANTSVIGATGDDEAADALQIKLESSGICCSFVRLPGVPTITKLRVISQHQQLIRLDHEEAFDGLSQDVIEEKVAQLIYNQGALVLSDYSKGTLKGCQQLIRLAQSNNIPVLADPKGSNFSKYSGATLVTPNLNEFETIVGACHSEQELVRKGHELLMDLEFGALLITRSELGMTLIQPHSEPVHFQTTAREVYDVTGAGDTVISVLAASLAAGCDLVNALDLANIAAGVVVSKLGTASVSTTELRRAALRKLDVEVGAVSTEQLMVAVDDARAHGDKIVFTNGCFDILHAGHVRYLEQARKQGDRLVLAINSDESVARLKGEGRPINTVDRRMAVLAGLEAVDWVVSFEEDTPENLLKKIKPDVLVKGGDYSIKDVVGAPIVYAYGGEVKVLDFLENCSTTDIVDKIRSKKEAQSA